MRREAAIAEGEEEQFLAALEEEKQRLQEEAAAEEAAREAALKAAEEEAAAKPIELSDLPLFVHKMEDRLRAHLMKSWSEIEESYISNLHEMFSWQRRLREEFSRGLRKTQEDFIHFIEADDERQSILDGFIANSNRFISHHPDMMSTDEAKAEMLLRCDDLNEQIWVLIDRRRGEAINERQRLKTSFWADIHLEHVISLIQRLVQVEYARYRGQYRLLEDFYICALKLGLPLVPPPPTETLQVLPLPIEDGLRESDPAKAQQQLQAQAEAVQSLRVWDGEPPMPYDVAPQDTGITLRGAWRYPCVEELFTKARAMVVPLKDLIDPLDGEKEPVDPKAKTPKKDDPKSKKPADKGAAQETSLQQQIEKPAYIDLQNALIEIGCQYVLALDKLAPWGQALLSFLSESADEVLRLLDDWIVARVYSENEAVNQLVNTMKGYFEQGKQLPHHLVLTSVSLLEDTNTRLFTPPPPPESFVPQAPGPHTEEIRPPIPLPEEENW
eukprot:GHVR01143311.1.p1 GENE.GHVR01143311.1~~GHVR01143311.1.p1  ORF type:complete len:499 (-),score=120.02 GHVR01143311.1:214-1710(-)